MTSQKSLKNNINFNDFKRSLGGSLIFPAIAFVIIFFCVTAGIIDFFYGQTRDGVIKSDYVYIFFTQTSMFDSAFEMLQTGMVLCGMMTAAKSFYFLLSKKQVNVYLSLGVTRTKMFINRLVSGAITLFTSVFVPFTIIYLINMAELGVTSQLRNVYLYIVFSLFVASMVGFAISSFAMMVSGNIFESVLTTGIISFLPTIVANIFYVARDVLLKGFVYDSNYYDNVKFFNPFTFINNSEQRANNDTIIPTINRITNLFQKTDMVDGATLKDYAIDWDFIRPVLIWFVIAVAIKGLALFLFNKRKAEHSNSLGKFAISRIIDGTFAICIVFFFCFGVLWYEIGTVGTTLLAIVASFVAYFIIQLVLTRKLKTSLKSLSACAVVVITFVGLVVFIETEYFGTYNKLPEKENIKSVSITVQEDFASNFPFPENPYIASTNPDDISMVMSLFDEVKKDNGDENLSIRVAYFKIETKDGEIIHRAFSIYSPEINSKYCEEVVNSNFFDGVLEYEFLGFDENNKSKNGEYTYITSDRYMISEPDKVAAVNYYDSQLLVPYVPAEKESETDTLYQENVYDKEYGEEDRQIIIYKGDDLAVAIYNDLSKMTYAQLYKNNSKPLSVLGFESDYVCQANDVLTPTDSTNEDSYYYDNAVEDVAGVKAVGIWLGIYPEMTETIAYFKNNNIDFIKTYNGSIKEVLYTDSKLTFTNAGRDFVEQVVTVKGENAHYKYFSWDRKLPIVSFYNTTALPNSGFYSLSWYISEKITKEDLLKKIYADIGHPLKAVEKDNIDNVLSASVGNYDFYNDNGRIVYIIYEDGSMIAKYLPEANKAFIK